MRASPALRLTGSLAVLFGVATVISGARVLLGVPAAVAAAGDVVPFVLGFNTLAGVAYVAAGIAAATARGWAVPLARLLAAGTLVVFAAFALHVLRGGAYAPRTGWAMVFRAGFWVAIALAWPAMFRRAGPAVPP